MLEKKELSACPKARGDTESREKYAWEGRPGSEHKGPEDTQFQFYFAV